MPRQSTRSRKGLEAHELRRSPLPTRRDRVKARTRAALIQAAQRCILEGRLHPPVLEITQRADVGLGSFYNHFATREELFAAATADALESLGAILDEMSADMVDPAAVLTQGFRLTGRLFRSEAALMQVVMSAGAELMQSTSGLVPRARRDIAAGIREGRFTVGDVDLGLAMVVGTAICLEHMVRLHPDRDAAAMADGAAAGLLRMLGIAADEAERIAKEPLPSLTREPGWGHPSSHVVKSRQRPRRQRITTADTED